MWSNFSITLTVLLSLYPTSDFLVTSVTLCDIIPTKRHISVWMNITQKHYRLHPKQESDQRFVVVNVLHGLKRLARHVCFVILRYIASLVTSSAFCFHNFDYYIILHRIHKASLHVISNICLNCKYFSSFLLHNLLKLCQSDHNLQ